MLVKFLNFARFLNSSIVLSIWRQKCNIHFSFQNLTFGKKSFVKILSNSCNFSFLAFCNSVCKVRLVNIRLRYRNSRESFSNKFSIAYISWYISNKTKTQTRQSFNCFFALLSFINHLSIFTSFMKSWVANILKVIYHIFKWCTMNSECI